jgi:hypothetical protein
LPARRPGPVPVAPLTSLRPVLIAWILLSALTLLPYVRAALAPPPGRTFVGFFLFVDDSYNYLSFVQQAEAGRLAFDNKLVLEPHGPALVNLEWLTVGLLSTALGHSPLVAYRIFGLAAAFLLLWAIDTWLRRCGLPDRHRLAALLLVAGGGGLGGLASKLTSLPLTDCLDLSTGLFPALELLMSPHFVIATALLLWTLAALVEERAVAALVLGSILALVRPYDFVFLVLIRVAGVVLSGPARLWGRRLLPLAGYAPVVAYNYWLFYRNPAFTTFHAVNELIFPPWYAFVIALAPPVVLAAVTFRGLPQASPRAYGVHLFAWLGAALLIIVAPPVHFALQFLVGVGVPILILAALGLARISARALTAGALGLSSTAVLALAMTLGPDAHWYAPTDAFAIARALAPACRQGDVAVTAGAAGLYVGGLSPCRAFTSHANEPDHVRRVEASRWFYGSDPSPAERALFLDRLCARFVLLPSRVAAEGFLGRAPGPRAGEAGALSVYDWSPPAGCARSAY